MVKSTHSLLPKSPIHLRNFEEPPLMHPCIISEVSHNFQKLFCTHYIQENHSSGHRNFQGRDQRS